MERWKTYQRDTIKNFIFDLIEQEGVIMWQQIEGNRVQYNVRIKDVINDQCIAYLDMQEVKSNALVENQPIYMHAKIRELVFKVNSFDLQANKIDFSLPTEIVCREKRKQERLLFRAQDQKMVSLDEGKQGLLVDLNQKGVGVRLLQKDTSSLKPGMEIAIHAIAEVQFQNPLMAVICHTTSFHENGENLIILGLQFLIDAGEPLNAMIQEKQKRQQGLFADKFCGLSYEEQIGKLASIESENRQLAINIRKNIDQLDRIRYLTSEMKVKLLETVELDLLACALRLSSKELVYELLIEVTQNIQDEFVEKLAVVMPASAVCKAQDKIVKVLLEKEKDGDFRMDPKTKTEYV